MMYWWNSSWKVHEDSNKCARLNKIPFCKTDSLGHVVRCLETYEVYETDVASSSFQTSTEKSAQKKTTVDGKQMFPRLSGTIEQNTSWVSQKLGDKPYKIEMHFGKKARMNFTGLGDSVGPRTCKHKWHTCLSQGTWS